MIFVGIWYLQKGTNYRKNEHKESGDIMKKLLILAGADPHCKVVEAAKEMGIYTIVTDYLTDSPAKKIADESWMINITDVDAIVERCRQVGISGVLNFCIDPAQKPYQRICEKLGLPCIGTAEQFDIFTDKRKFKKTCLQYGVDVIREYSIDDVIDGSPHYPLLVKPAESRGSRGQTICYNQQEVLDAIKYAEEISSNGEALIEEYMGGKPDFSLTYLVKDGKPYLVRTADRHLGSVESGMSRQTVASVSPSRFTRLLLENVHEKICNFLKCVGIVNGPVLMQGFVDGNTIKFYDPGLRFPGNEYAGLFSIATDMNAIKSMICFALGEGVDNYNGALENSWKLKGKRIFQLMYNVAPGKVAEIKGIETVKNHPLVFDVKQRIFVGDAVTATGDIKQRACEVAMLFDDAHMVEMIQFVQETIKFVDTRGRNMRLTNIDPQEMSRLYTFSKEEI